MTDPTYQYQLLARQFIDTWQQQLSAMLVDERFVAQMIDALQKGPYAAAQQPNAPTSQPSVSPDATGDAIRSLERRLGASEARIAELERELAELRRNAAVPGGRGGAGTSRKPRVEGKKPKPA